MVKVKEVRHLQTLESPNEASDFIENAKLFIKENIGPGEKVIAPISGGVDSTIVGYLFKEAIGDRLYPIHIDTGFMRSINGEDECELVAKRLEDLANFELVDAKKDFQESIFAIEKGSERGIGEDKRNVFRDKYAETINKKAREHGCSVATQGTIAPDIEETVDKKLKSQNNVEVPLTVNRLVEPIAGLDKRGVRILAREMNLPKSVWLRIPFPGPGLSVRIVGRANKEKLNAVRFATDIVEQNIDNYNDFPKYNEETGVREPFQMFAGVFDNAYTFLYRDKINGKQIYLYDLENKVTGINKFGGRAYSNPLVVEGDLTLEELMSLNERLRPTTDHSRILYKLCGDLEGKDYFAAIRAVISKDARTAQPLKLPLEYLKELGEKITKGANISSVFYDVTPKPPSTIEYE